ncbi:MAG: dipeptide ABC transporter ATP-binding protein [Veillonellales bacterium]
MPEPPLIETRNLSKHFVVKRSFFGKSLATVKAVDNVSFHIQSGETLGLVGETGCGKSTLGRILAGLYKPSAGQALFKGQNLHQQLNSRGKMIVRRKIQMIFQDPFSSLNPRMTVGEIIGEPLTIHQSLSGDNRRQKIGQLLQQVGLSPEQAGRFPHEFSGGQRQRIGIARALAVNPEFIICDEPISALDVSIQAQIVNLLQQLQTDLGLTYLFIAHDLAMIKHISSRVAVMYLGSIVELSPCQDLYQHPRHPYTQALLSSIPLPDPLLESKRQRILLHGDLPSPLYPPSGCKFRTRCQYAMPRCAETVPAFRTVFPGHYAACHQL